MKKYTHERNSLPRQAKDAIILLFVFLTVCALSIHFDLFELIVEKLGKDIYELDEIILSFALLSIFFSLYIIRRWYDLRILLVERDNASHSMESANRELEERARIIQDHALRYEKLSKLVTFLQVCKTKEEIFQLVSDSVEKLFPGSSGNLFIMRDSRNQLVSVGRWGNDRSSPEQFSPEGCWGLRLGKRYSFVPERDDPLCLHAQTKENISFSCIPLTAYGEVIGLFHISVPGNVVEHFKEVELELVEQSLIIFTEQVSLAISNMSLHDKMKHMAIHDQLTGLYNRQFLEETFEREVHRARRKHRHIGVLMVDLDHFKTFNDQYGHAAGDVLLKEIGKLFKEFFRADDFCCRFGGEEFVILVPNITVDELRNKSENLRQRIGQMVIEQQGNSHDKVTGSIGVAIYPDCGDSFQELVEAADKALYQAKNEGRNRVCFAADMGG